MSATTLKQRLRAVRARFRESLPGDPTKRMLRSWCTRYRNAIELLKVQA